MTAAKARREIGGIVGSPGVRRIKSDCGERQRSRRKELLRRRCRLEKHRFISMS
jgi:hypothetical protein